MFTCVETHCNYRRNIQKFFVFLDVCLANNRISKTVFRVNLHLLTHVGEMIREQGVMRAYSCRAVERTIKDLKNKMNAARYAGENASNIIEIETILSFLKSMKMVDFDGNSHPPGQDTYEDHPEKDLLEDVDQSPQLWSPFGTTQISLNIQCKNRLIENTFSVAMMGDALYNYIGRLDNKNKREIVLTGAQAAYNIRHSARLWLNNFTYHSQLYKSKNKNVTKEGYYAMFRYGQKVYRGK